MHQRDILVSVGVVISQCVESFLLSAIRRISTGPYVFSSDLLRSTNLPLEHNQRGDSGTNHTNATCNTEGRACNAEGILHDQLVGTWNVPNVYNEVE